MGWFSSSESLVHRSNQWNSVSNKQALIALLTERTVKADLNVQCTRICLAHCYRGNSFAGVLWSVQELTYEALPGTPADTVVPEPHRWICCDLMKFRREANDAAWWYKPLTEQDGPVATSCPPSYLEMVPISNSTNEVWRQRVKFTAAVTAAKSQFTKAYRRGDRLLAQLALNSLTVNKGNL